MRTNSFTKKMSEKSNTELENIFEAKSDYTDEAVQAVIWELENRNLIEKTEVPELETPKDIDSEEISIPKEELEDNESPFEELVVPILYSKKAILGFSILFSTIFGVVLLMSNLKAMNKPKARIEVLIFGITYVILTYVLLNYIQKTIFIPILFNFIGYAVLTEYYWNRNLGKDLQHRKKEIWKPLIISISITVLFIFLILSTQASAV